eukprot:29427-Eustigmatos_ZCMA.PRE.1
MGWPRLRLLLGTGKSVESVRHIQGGCTGLEIMNGICHDHLSSSRLEVLPHERMSPPSLSRDTRSYKSC